MSEPRADEPAERGVAGSARYGGRGQQRRRFGLGLTCVVLSAAVSLRSGAVAADVPRDPAGEAPRAAAPSPTTQAPRGDTRLTDAAALFEQGVAELKARRFEVACPTLERSQILEPNPGTLLALADCLERWQKLASASAHYAELIDVVSRTSAESSYRAEQLAFARAALARLEPQIPRLQLMTSVPLPSEARVLLDGRELASDEFARELMLDPGQHVIETQAVGHEARRHELELKPGEHGQLELTVGPALPPPPAASRGVMREAAPSTPRVPIGMHPEGERAASGAAWRSVGWGLGGLGVAGVGVGVVAGAMLLETCPGLDCVEHRERGKRLALITDIGVGVGIAALVSSVIVLVNTTPAVPSRDGAAGWQPVGTVQAGGGWLGMSHRF